MSDGLRLYSVPEACQSKLGNVSASLIYKHILAETIPATHIGRRVFLTEETVEEIRTEGLPSLPGPNQLNGHGLEEALA